MQVITIEESAFFELLERAVKRLSEKFGPASDPVWIPGPEAMRMLGIRSKTTLQRYRDEGKIRFSQVEKKVILYDRASVLAYLERKAKGAFFNPLS